MNFGTFSRVAILSYRDETNLIWSDRSTLTKSYLNMEYA